MNLPLNQICIWVFFWESSFNEDRTFLRVASFLFFSQNFHDTEIWNIFFRIIITFLLIYWFPFQGSLCWNAYTTFLFVVWTYNFDCRIKRVLCVEIIPTQDVEILCRFRLDSCFSYTFTEMKILAVLSALLPSKNGNWLILMVSNKSAVR